MAAALDTERLRLAFQSRPDLVTGIQKAADSPARVALFNSITSFVHDQLCASGNEPALKRRRVEDDTAAAATASNGQHLHGTALPARQAAVGSGGAAGLAAAAAAETPLLEIKDISLSMPQRKKFDLCLTDNFLYARAPGTATPVQGIVYAWQDIEYIFYVPVPDKAQVQYNYILFPRGQALASLFKNPPPSATDGLPEPLLFTIAATAPKPGSVNGPLAGQAAAVSDSYSTLLHWALDQRLRAAGNPETRVVGTDPRVFHSVARQAYRPGDKAVHVRAFRGSKEGCLFFLPTGILWGFKKPLLFLPLDRLVAVSYTNVLQRTFNVVVEVDVGDNRTEEIEFGMLDQEDYGGIDETYVRRHGLQDRSMAEQRKAKRELAENAREDAKMGEQDEAADGADGAASAPDDGLTELQRAEQQLQDEEDEMEEDYDPGSDEDSGGSGGSSDEDEDDEDEDEEEDGEDEDEDEDELEVSVKEEA